MSRAIPSPLAAALLVAAATLGCKESPTEPADVLSLEEAQALYRGVFAFGTEELPDTVFFGLGGVSVFACHLGGELSATGSATDHSVGDTARVTVELTLDPDRCVVRSEGYQFTLDGNPSVRLEMTTSSVGGFEQFTIDGTTTGGVDWQLEDRSGTCVIDVRLYGDIDLSSSTPGNSGSVSGTLCGMDVDF